MVGEARPKDHTHDLPARFAHIDKTLREHQRRFALANTSKAISAHTSASRTAGTGAWGEYTAFDVVDFGGAIENGDLSLSGGRILVTTPGFYVFIVSQQWPTPAAGGYVAIQMGTDVGGLGALGPGNTGTQTTMFDSVVTAGIISQSCPFPRAYNAGDVVTGYLRQSSSGAVTLAAGSTAIAGYRVG